MSVKIEKTEPPVTEAMIFICEKCGKKIASDAANNPAREIVDTLKAEIKANGHKGKLRAVLTSCMDICPENEIAMAISRPIASNDYFTLKGQFKSAPQIILEFLGAYQSDS